MFTIVRGFAFAAVLVAAVAAGYFGSTRSVVAGSVPPPVCPPICIDK